MRTEGRSDNYIERRGGGGVKRMRAKKKELMLYYPHSVVFKPSGLSQEIHLNLRGLRRKSGGENDVGVNQ